MIDDILFLFDLSITVTFACFPHPLFFFFPFSQGISQILVIVIVGTVYPGTTLP